MKKPAKTKDQKLKTVSQLVSVRYEVQCPWCNDWHQSDADMSGEIIECICDERFRVSPNV